MTETNDFAKPLASVALVAVGTSMLFPAASYLGLVPRTGMLTTGLAMAGMAIAGGVAGWYLHKSTSSAVVANTEGKEHSRTKEISGPARQPDMTPELQAQVPEKEWATREALHENVQLSRER